MSERAERCEGCRYWFDAGNGVPGRCKRYPPPIVGVRATWPHDWCGEYAARVGGMEVKITLPALGQETPNMRVGKSVPDQDGYWWVVRPADIPEPILVYVWTPITTAFRRVGYLGTDKLEYLADLPPGSQWYGPLVPPRNG